MITIKNISDANIIINKITLLPGDEMELTDEEFIKYKKLLDNNICIRNIFYCYQI